MRKNYPQFYYKNIAQHKQREYLKRRAEEKKAAEEKAKDGDNNKGMEV